MTTLPQSNARLTAIIAPGFSEDGGQAATVGSAKWSGNTDAYVSERLLTALGSSTLDLLKRTTVVIPGDLRPSVSLEQGDTLTYDYAGQTYTRKVRDFQAHLMQGARRTVRIDVEDT